MNRAVSPQKSWKYKMLVQPDNKQTDRRYLAKNYNLTYI